MYKSFQRLFEKRLEEALLVQPKLQITLSIGEASEFPEARDYAYSAWDGQRANIVFAPKIRHANTARQDALIRHELSHALLQTANIKHNEKECDNLAEDVFGDRLYYDVEDVQTLNSKAKGATDTRPKHLPNPRGNGNGSDGVGSSISIALNLPTLPKKPKPGFYRKTRSVVVYVQPTGRDDGNKPAHQVHSWRGTPKPETFQSSMVRWGNMNFMGGYHWRPQIWKNGVYQPYGSPRALVNAVIRGKKPAGVTGSIGGVRGNLKADIKEAKALHKKAKAAGLLVGPLDLTDVSWIAFYFAQSGTFGDHFDLDSWVTTWEVYGEDMSEWAKRLEDMPLITLIERFADDGHSLIGPVTGLLLGYPVFSTVSVWRF